MKHVYAPQLKDYKEKILSYPCNQTVAKKREKNMLEPEFFSGFFTTVWLRG